MKPQKHNILWVDALGALFVGVVVLLFSGFLSAWFQLPQGTVLLLALANLLYGTYSFTLAKSSRRSKRFIAILATLNLMWTAVCLAVFMHYAERISVFGAIHLLAEGIYVGVLGLLEWRWRHDLLR